MVSISNFVEHVSDPSFQGVVMNDVLRHSLEGFRISIYGDKSKPQNVLESYAFSFTYADGTVGVKRQLMGLGLPGSDNGTLTTGGAWSSYDRFVRQLHDYHISLRDLPSQFPPCQKKYYTDRFVKRSVTSCAISSIPRTLICRSHDQVSHLVLIPKSSSPTSNIGRG